MTIIIDWELISAPKDFFSQFLPQVKAPEWHGYNLNALNDSLVTGDINGISPPYEIKNINFLLTQDTLTDFKHGVIQIFVDSASRHAGTRISITS